jgi:O-antigen/teichoic acid export membrane protein
MNSKQRSFLITFFSLYFLMQLIFAILVMLTYAYWLPNHIQYVIGVYSIISGLTIIIAIDYLIRRLRGYEKIKR